MLHLLYNIRGVVSRNVIQCYIGWGVVKNFQFLRYIICARPLFIISTPVTPHWDLQTWLHTHFSAPGLKIGKSPVKVPPKTFQSWSSYQLSQLGSNSASDSILKQLITCGVACTVFVVYSVDLYFMKRILRTYYLRMSQKYMPSGNEI